MRFACIIKLAFASTDKTAEKGMKIKYSLKIMTSKSLAVLYDTPKCVEVLKEMVFASLKEAVPTIIKFPRRKKWLKNKLKNL